MKGPITYKTIQKALKISPLKRYGQNFLLDENITNKMAKSAGVKNCHVVEVGPGPGSLTRSMIIEGCSEIDCVEIDRRFSPFLTDLSNSTHTPMRVHFVDIFQFDFAKAFNSVQPVDWNEANILPKARMVGNLPFNISIGILLQWLQAVSENKGPFRLGRIPMYLTFQKEVAENLYAKNIHDTSRLTIMTQNFCHVKQVQFIHRSHFSPVPRVDTVFVQLIPRVKPIVEVPFKIFEQVVKGVFQYPNKIISNGLKYFLSCDKDLVDKILVDSEIDPSLFVDSLSLNEWNRLCKSYVKIMQELEIPLIVQPTKSPPPIVDTTLEE